MTSHAWLLVFLQFSSVIYFAQGTCNAPNVINNASPSSFLSSFSVGFVMSYDCNHGYQLEGSPNTRECQADSTWTMPQVQCQPQSCGMPDSPTNGGFLGNDFTFGNRVTYFCNKGYIMVDPDKGSRANCAIDLSDSPPIVAWSVPPPVCNIVTCPAPPATPNGSFNDRGLAYEYGTRIEYSCNPGFKAIETDPIYRTCNENGTWGNPPICDVNYGCDFQDNTNRVCGFTNVDWTRSLVSERYNNKRGFVLASTPGMTSTLTSATINDNLANVCVRFYYRINSISNDGFLSFNATNGSSSISLWSTSVMQSSWKQVSRPIQPRAGDSFVIQATGSNFDAQIDEISVDFTSCDDDVTTSSVMTSTSSNVMNSTSSNVMTSASPSDMSSTVTPITLPPSLPPSLPTVMKTSTVLSTTVSTTTSGGATSTRNPSAVSLCFIFPLAVYAIESL